MLTREPFRYKVQLQHTGTGQLEEVPYAVHWSPEKVDSSEVAIACAAEKTKEAGFNEVGQPKDKVLGLTAILQKSPKVTASTTKKK